MSEPATKQLREFAQEHMQEPIQDFTLEPAPLVRTQHESVRSTLAFLHEHYRRDLSLLEIAAHVQLSPAYLSHLFHKESGVHLMTYLAGYRMERAKRLLRTTNHTVREISRMVGYHECSYFTSVFRKHHKCTPSQFRNGLVN